MHSNDELLLVLWAIVSEHVLLRPKNSLSRCFTVLQTLHYCTRYLLSMSLYFILYPASPIELRDVILKALSSMLYCYTDGTVCQLQDCCAIEYATMSRLRGTDAAAEHSSGQSATLRQVAVRRVRYSKPA